ncbi:Prephenate dehydrogenase [Stanieria cyanosphaera PCC 7437]|uniref:Prephenate dehydrogenase n=1 Tax=Stanieria cyanosphaera (strain ATCC 29371 / PCC 7437) TaxID=111780 RepID=K9XYT0_STAC7|nr:prephenate/arogenate dehydrogenase [Stanieria cyanosphaera]AFZ37760.1 Prephenate dehydrogenase [Stanieria cyanosphaera PCC 7437]
MKIGIVGLGLIGGSLGIDLRTQGHQILGVSRKETTCLIAVEKGVVDQASTDLKLLSQAEIIFVCTPIATIISTVKELIPYLNPNAVVTDVGSVKGAIAKPCSQLWSNFVGGHPMAGTSEQGIDAAVANLFEGAAYVFTPTAQTRATAVEKLTQIAQSLGANTYICSPEEHDRAVALISHLPVMISTSLIAACLGEEEVKVLELAQQLASSGFRDTSRVGGGNPELGLMMAQYNRLELLRSLYQYRHSLDGIIKIIEQENWENLEQILATNQQTRPQFLN